MPFIVPADFPEYHDQKEQTNCTEEEFQGLFAHLKPTLFQRIIRMISFIVSLAWLRLTIFLILLCIFTIILLFLAFLQKHFFPKSKLFKTLAFYILTPISRIAFFFLQFAHVKINGKILPTTRTLIANHLTFFDATLAFSYFRASFLIMAGAKNSFFMQALSNLIDFIFVDRSKKEGITTQMIEIQQNKDLQPLIVFPEGKITNGNALIGFRTGAFISDTPIQAICIRYKSWFSNKEWASPSWLDDGIFDYVYQLLSIPFCTVEFNILPPLNIEGKSPAERAVAYQLQMANFLGIPAYSKTNKAIFQKKEE
jgi:1-acyl-sn-glycerol-3-phosphate acyltransferase